MSPRRPGHDPTRRNRNIGTPKRGYRRSNWYDIPWPDDRLHCDRLRAPVVLEWEIDGETWTFLVEPTLEDHVYAVTPADVARVLELIPREDTEGLRVVVFRQGTRKQLIFSPAWGRWGLAERMGSHDGKVIWCGLRYRWAQLTCPALFLEAVDPSQVVRWPRGLDPDDQRELERLRRDGHRIEEERRHHALHYSLQTCRATQLYRTLPHEIGHHVDFWQKVMKRWDGKDEKQWDELADRFWSRPGDEGEAFAHRYADTFKERMIEAGALPFEREFDAVTMADHGIDAAWFGLAR